jgi:hypothetical protein
LFTPNFIFNQYFNIVANQINFEDSKKTERNHGFYFLSFILTTEIAPHLKHQKNILPDETKIYRCCFSLGLL